MTAILGHQVANWADEAAADYQREQDRLARADRELGEELTGLAQRLVQAWEQLTVTLVPGLVAEHLDWAANLIHLPAIAAAPVHERIAADRQKLELALAQLEADPDYIDRTLKLNECEIQIAELERPLAPLREATTALAADSSFQHLIFIDYGTPAYLTKWWELAYYRHWKQGDFLVELFGESRGLNDFAALRGRYEQELAARHTLETELAGWVAERARIEALAQHHAQLQTRLETLDDRQWTQTRSRVHQHLSELDSATLLELFASYEPALYAAKRVAGIEAKQRYLQALRHTWIQQPSAQVKRKYEKAKRGAIKYRRAKHYDARFDFDGMQRKYRAPKANWDKRWHKFNAAYAPIVAFDRYDDYRPGDNVIWWHLMTGGAVKARFIPDVDAYYSHGDKHGRRSKSDSRDDAHELAVAALADQALSAGAATDANFDDWS